MKGETAMGEGGRGGDNGTREGQEREMVGLGGDKKKMLKKKKKLKREADRIWAGNLFFILREWKPREERKPERN